MRFRKAVLISLSVVVAASVAACSSSSDAPQNGTSASDQTLRVAIDALPASKGNPFDSVGSPGIYTLAAIYDPLTFVDKSGNVKPWLATSWERTADTVWQFTLRDGVKFSNGEALDAKGVASVINYMKANDKLSSSPVAGDLSNIAKAKAVDAKTLEITTTAPEPILPNKLTELYVPAPQVLVEQGVQAITDKPVGTGPFKLTNWGSNRIKLSAYADSWRAPKVGALEIQALPGSTARLQALQSGQVDLATGVSPDQAEQLTGDVEADITKIGQVMSLAFIDTKGKSPLNGQKVRLALNYAIDRKALADNLLLGKGDPVGQGTAPNATGYNSAIDPYPYDTDKAKQLLTEAGYPNGFKMTADVVVGSFPADGEIYQLMKQDLAKVGVDVKLQQVTFASWLDKYLGNTWDSEAFGLSWNALPTMDGARAMSLFSCLKQPAFFCDKATADLLSKAKTNLDTDSRTSQLEQVSQTMHENPPALYLVRQIDINGLASNVEGFVDENRFFPYDQMVKN